MSNRVKGNLVKLIGIPVIFLLLGFLLGSSGVLDNVFSRAMVFSSSGITGSKLFRKADNQFDRGEYNEASRSYSALIESGLFMEGKLGAAYENRGWCRIRLGDYGPAEGDFDRAIQLNPGSAAAFNGRGWAKVKREEYDAALDDFRTANDLSPRYAMVFTNHGVALANLGKRDEARKNYMRAVEIDNDREAKGYALLNLAWLDYQDGRFESAFALADQGVRILPDYAMGYNDRGAIREDMGEYEEAIVDYSRAIELNRDPEAVAQSRLNRGVARLMAGNPDAAETDFTAVLHSQLPMREEAAIWLWIAMLKQGKTIDEIEERISELIPKDQLADWPSPALRLFQGKTSMDDYTASYWHPNPVKRRSRRAEMFFYAGQYLLYRGETGQAREYFQRSIDLEVIDTNATRMAKLILEEMD